MSEQVWYLLIGVAIVVVVLALIFRRGKFGGTLKALGVEASVEGSGRSSGAATEKPAIPPAPAGLSASDGGIVVGRDANGNFNTGSRARVGDERKR